MSCDFADSCQRHWDDAERLFSSGRWANADHLYGFSAESALKRLMLAFGMHFNFERDMPRDRDDRQHIDLIWQRYQTYQGNCHSAGAYALDPVNPFHDWRASQRYDHQSAFSQHIADSHRYGAMLAKDILKQAQLDGVVPI